MHYFQIKITDLKFNDSAFEQELTLAETEKILGGHKQYTTVLKPQLIINDPLGTGITGSYNPPIQEIPLIVINQMCPGC